MICRVAGGMDGSKRPAIAFDDANFWRHDVRHELRVAARIEKVDLSYMQRAGGAMRAFRHQSRTEFSLQHACQGRVIAVGVADENMADRAPGYGTQECRLVRFVDGTWIDQGQCIFADQIGIGAVKGKRARIIDGNTLDIRRNIDRLAIMRRKYIVENEGHCWINLFAAFDVLQCGMILNIPFS